MSPDSARTSRPQRGAERGAATAELALVLPVLVAVTIGLVWLLAVGAAQVRTVERLADELAASARADVEDRARAVGVKAAVPLGLCLLPAFVLLGVVPLVAGMLAALEW